MHIITIHKAYKHVHTHTNTLATHIQFIQTIHVHKHIHLCLDFIPQYENAVCLGAKCRMTL